MKEIVMLNWRLVLVAVCVAPSLALAQAPQPRRVQEIREVRRIGVGVADGGDNLQLTWASEAFEGKPVKDAPYTATAVTELEQTLGDGNRIRQKTTSQLARDREGRSRRALTLGAVGPLAAGGETPKMTFLQDPVSGNSYILDSEQKTARRLPRPTEITAPAPADGKPTRIEDETFHIAVPPPGAGGLHDVPGGAGPMLFAAPIGAVVRKMPKPKTEDLGSQLIEGVRANGTRSTVTIPAGEMGNERPIVSVTERWFSPDLGVVVMSKHSDPRMGTTTYRLTDVRRGDPDPTLFQVPPGYTVKEDLGQKVIIRKRAP
jgi:hypothetical protein